MNRRSFSIASMRLLCGWMLCLTTVGGMFAFIGSLRAAERVIEEATEAATEAADIEAVAKQARLLIAKLDSKTFAERERAENALLKIGEPVIPQLLEARRNALPEIRLRSKRLVYRIEHPILLREFRLLLEKPDAELDLDRGMWLIARVLNPVVKFKSIDEQLDAIAKQVEQEIHEQVGPAAKPAEVDPKIVVAAMKKVLADDLGFRGNRGDYEDPKNSSIEHVLESRKGLPILLSHVVVSVANRLDVPMVGIPIPGQYMVKYEGRLAPKGFPKDDIIIDPYGGWSIVAVAELKRLVPRFRPEYVKPSSKRLTLLRMMSNLLSDYEEAGNTRKMSQLVEYARLINSK